MKKSATLVCFLLFLLSFCSQPQRQPDEVRVRLFNDPVTLNPVNYQNSSALQLVNLLFQSLLTVDLEDNTLKPSLAEDLPVVERTDSTTLFTYSIREEAEWADGSPVTAADVAFTLKVMLAPLVNNEQIKSQIEFIRDIASDQRNPKRFTLLCKGFSPEMELLTGDYFILPQYLFDPENLLASFSVPELVNAAPELTNNKSLKAFATHFNSVDFARSKDLLKGSAGYVLENWTTGQYVVLKRKQNWWGTNTGRAASYLTANPRQINFQIIPDNTTALLALKNRQLDVLSNIPATEFDKLREDSTFTKEYALHAPDSYEYNYIALNTRLPKLNNRYTRQALAHLVDADNLIKVTLSNFGTRTAGPVPPAIQPYYNQSIRPYEYSQARAISLLKAAGWIREGDGWYKTIDGKKEKLTLEVNYRAGNTVFEHSALIFQQNAAKAGIVVELQAMENSLFRQKARTHDFEMVFRSLSGNPFIFNFKPFFHSAYSDEGGSNITGIGSPETDALLDAINVAETDREKARLLKRLQEILHEEAAMIPLYYLKERIAVHKRFANTKISGLKPNYDVSAFTLKN
ncbi:ABC transporter substrate-binding protein [Pontibacter beigongshangensis]|uniref:ABC transporter substrate-binding protein n=1 Tax=Pontibacter beigongshangensis TaxID=2574733 RepID=UPI001F5079C9|nr:ABC transporter substrate-binding protein [Pontibacter beigongshangensis]